METSDLTTEAFWRDSRCRVMVNERDATAVVEATLIREWVKDHRELDGHLLFATSGSTGARKWVALSRDALLVSAEVVNRHLGVDSSDRWLLALPTFHVGGMGILARSYTASREVVTYRGKWDARSFHRLSCQEGITLSSMVPTQLVDLVRLGLKAPAPMRAVLIGGGRLDDAVYQHAVDLGWPVVETYGMTETCSQVATANPGSRALTLLPSWQATTDESGRLMLRGESLLSAYIHCEGGAVRISDPKVDGWFLTGDVVEIGDRVLSVKGRADRCVKILGELVSLDEVERVWMDAVVSAGWEISGLTVVDVDDLRNGSRLVLCLEGAKIPDDLISSINKHRHPLHRVASVQAMDSFPRSPLGKVLQAELRNQLAAQQITNL